MSRRKPPDRIDLPRKESVKRNLSPEPPSEAARTHLAGRAWYKGYGKHKRNPYIWDLDPWHGISADRTFCEDAGFELADKSRIDGLLERGIEAGLFGDLVDQGDPTMLWTIDDNGWIYELRLTTASQAEYHGYPMRPSNVFGQKVVARYRAWLETLPSSHHRAEPQLRRALHGASSRYR